jgi:DNA-binding CsgD family transcriptional regulator
MTAASTESAHAIVDDADGCTTRGSSATEAEAYRRLITPVGNIPLPPEAARPLTARQVAILRLLATGHPNKTIAIELAISISAVGSHVTRLAARYGVSGRAGIVGAAAELGELPRRRLHADIQK